MTNELLSVRDLSVHFPIKKGVFSRTAGYVYAVQDVSFDLGRGETLGVVGESGCGKTTTGLALMGLVPPTSGEVIFEGCNVIGMPRAELRLVRARMQMVFQDPFSSLNPRMSIGQIVGDPLYVHGRGSAAERRERVDFLLGKVGLSAEHADRYPHELSGGQRQRAGIARALALEPSLIVADEPVSALDVSVQAQIINLLGDLQQEFELSYVVISHDLAVVEHISDRVAVMYLGRIVELAPWKKLYTSPAHPYTQGLLEAVPVADPGVPLRPPSFKGDLPSASTPPSGCAFHPRCPFRMERCERELPEPRDIGDGQTVACHLHD